MSTSPRVFEDKLATRAQVPLLVGLVAPSGGGKTYSALELATGIQSVTGGDIGFIDTEAKRALHYADLFNFRHLEFGAPFGSLDYLDAVNHFVGKGCRTIIVDSMSHEHEGSGGMLESHEAEMERMAGSDWQKRERIKMLAWQKPKSARRKFINALLQMNANFIFCFRAKEKMKMVKGEAPLPLGWQPIAGEEFVFEMTVNFLLLPASGGVPTWNPEHQGERNMIKLPEQFHHLFKEARALDRAVGREMALWAKGGAGTGKAASGASQAQPSDLPAAWAQWTTEERGENRARQGKVALQEWWKSIPAADQKRLKPTLDAEWKPLAEQADAARAAQ